MEKSVIVFFFLLTFLTSIFGQNSFNKELALRFDNEAITDQYYSSGLELGIRLNLKKTSTLYRLFPRKKDTSQNVNLGIHYGHQIYTPSDLSEKAYLENTQDRPYAGWQYLRLEAIHSPKKDRINHFNLELGWVGPKSGIGAFHIKWHDWLNIWKPFGWENQIADEPIINVSYDFIKEWNVGPFVGIISDSRLDIGNRLNQISQDLSVRLGEFNSLNSSSLYHNRLGKSLGKNLEKESFILVGTKLNYVIWNTFLQGSLFNNNSPLTVEKNPLYWDHYLGIQLSGKRYTIYVLAHFLSPEIRDGSNHVFVSYNLSLRI